MRSLRNTIYDALRNRPGWVETDSDNEFDFVSPAACPRSAACVRFQTCSRVPSMDSLFSERAECTSLSLFLSPSLSLPPSLSPSLSLSLSLSVCVCVCVCLLFVCLSHSLSL